MRGLGIDPGLNTTGYGVLDFASRQARLIEAGVVRSKASESLRAHQRIAHRHR